ncbi:hypothetical protein Pse7429DRAFT_1710, partial [Pseudanabaena biceps PCC 7429]
ALRSKAFIFGLLKFASLTRTDVTLELIGVKGVALIDVP